MFHVSFQIITAEQQEIKCIHNQNGIRICFQIYVQLSC